MEGQAVRLGMLHKMHGSKPVAVVIIPTYNEAKTIGKMIKFLLRRLFPTISDWQMKLLIVDDTSPDGTYKIVEKLRKKYDNLYLYLNPRKMGIGYAYVVGFRYAMKTLKADVIIEFDGDFQHPPEAIPLMLKKIQKGADYVLGSRKIKGGSVPKEWGWKRKFLTFFGGFMARFILFFPSKAFSKITDPTTGLKASRVKGFADAMKMDNLHSYNFGYKMDFLYQMVKLGARIKEIPLKFQLRRAGQSKITPSTAKDILRTVILLRWEDQTTQSFLKFAVVGFIGYLVNAIGLEAFYRLGAAPNWAAALGAELAIISNFSLNNIWSFAYKRISGLGAIFKKFLVFNATSAGAVVIQFLVVGWGTRWAGNQSRQLWLIVAIVFLIVPYNWLMYNKIIWRKKHS